MSICRLAIPFILPEEEEPTVALWPLRNITVEWTGATEKSFTKHPMHVISFLRVGNTCTSKSLIINGLLSSDEKRRSSHDTFFHRDLWSSGMQQRTVANGVVEVSYFIPPEGKKVFKQELILMNLRGDSSVYQSQRNLLGKMSSIIVIFIDVYDLAKEDVLTELEECRKASEGKVVLLLTCDPNNLPSKDLLNEYLKNVDSALFEYQPTFHYSEVFGANCKGECEVRASLRAALNRLLNSSDIQKRSLEQHAVCAGRGISVDEEVMKHCKDAKAKAQQVIQEMLGDAAIPSKKSLLSLQGKLWMKWTKHLKAKHRQGESATLQAIDKIQKDMDQVRHSQWKKCSDMPKFLKTFISILTSTSEAGASEYQYFFCRWLMIELDDISRTCLPSLRHTVDLKRRAFDSNKSDSKLENEMKKAEEDLYDAEIGIEHLMRELGQVYECFIAEHEANPKISIPAWTADLPGVAAKLLLSGLPLEVMNGDTGCVPLVWVKEILSSLEETMGNQKLFVLSCIGIQSSGKSTLLNAMFGLEFAVGAGRVSRGIFAQLLHVDKSRSNVPCDLVLVLDTEGLRAPERSTENYSNDNELATLVVGLADLTLVNIKGENITEIADVLEIVVHAFLRMQKANPFRKKKQKCMFLHQNVTAVNAKKKMANDHRLLRQKLDDRIRAVDSTRFQVCSFSEIIEFNEKRHAWYFYDLWSGNPPMAPANPQYAEKVRQVKQEIFNEATVCRSLNDLSDSLRDLWSGVLADDFVFSFRNSMSVKAYIEMETKYTMLNRKFESQLLEWSNLDGRAKIHKANTPADIGSCVANTKKELDRLATSYAMKKKKDLQDFFEESNLQEYMIHWKEEKLRCMEMDDERVKSNLKNRIDDFGRYRRVELRTQSTEPSHEREMMDKATELAEIRKGQNLSDEQIDRAFDELWDGWADRFAQDSPPAEIDIVADLSRLLRDQFPADRQMVSQEWQYKPLLSGIKYEPMQLEDTIGLQDIHGSYFHKKQSRARWCDRQASSSNKDRRIVLEHTNFILRKIDSKLAGLEGMDVTFHTAIAAELLDLVSADVDGFNDQSEKDCDIYISMNFRVMLANHVIRLAIPRFEQMNRNYESRHGVRARMEAYRAKVQNFFRNQVKQSADDVKAADLFCDSIVTTLIEAIDTDMSRKVVDAVIEEIPVKYHLIVKILEDLTSGEKFLDFMDYAADPKSYASRWVQNYTKGLIFRPLHDSTMYLNAAKEHLKKSVDAIKHHTQETTAEALRTNVSNLSSWLDMFCEQAPDALMLPRSSFGPRSIFDFSVNIKRFQGKLLNHLESARLKVLRVFEERGLEDVVWRDEPPYDRIMQQLWGCDARCPLCHEPCQKQGHHEDKHHSIQHRPTGIRGTRHLASQKLVSENCSFLVTTSRTFNCYACDKECRKTEHCNATDDKTYHPYKEYHQYMPAWDVAPDNAGEASQYWQWFMCKFNERMASRHYAQPADIPASWKRVTKERALASLRQFRS